MSEFHLGALHAAYEAISTGLKKWDVIEAEGSVASGDKIVLREIVLLGDRTPRLTGRAVELRIVGASVVSEGHVRVELEVIREVIREEETNEDSDDSSAE